MKPITPTSWSELLDELFKDSFNTEIERFRSNYAFRGLDDSSFKLDTSLIRLGGKYQELERHMIRNFKKYAHRDVVERDSLWHWLSVAQHHGLPTRLLDWTYSPFAALHFATADLARFNVDGAVWMIDFIEVHKHLPRVLRQQLDEVGGLGFDVDMLAFSLKDLPALDSIAPDEFMIIFEPPSIDDRIVNQYALFSVISNPTLAVDDWLSRWPTMYKKIIIPAKLKWEVRDKLDQINMTERVLFPGLDGLSRWLKRNYSPKS